MTYESQMLPPGRVNIPYEFVIGSSGGLEPYTWHIVKGDLPHDLQLDRKTGRIYGKPIQAGTFRFDLEVEHSSGSFVLNGKHYAWNGGAQKRSFELLLHDKLIHSLHLPTGRVGEPFFGSVTSNGRLPDEHIFWKVPLNELRPSQEGDSLVGTPTKPGTFQISYEIRRGNHKLGQGEGQIKILPAMPDTTLSPLTLQAWAGVAVQYPIPYRGLIEPVTVKNLAALPAGLEIRQNEIVGSPTILELAKVPLRIEDATGRTVDTMVNFRIGPPKEPLQIDAPDQITLVVGMPVFWSPTAQGGEGCYLWQLQGDLPPELEFSNNCIKGLLKTPGTWNLTSVVKDRITGETKKRALILRGVYAEESSLTLLTQALPPGTVGLPYDFLFSVIGGVGRPHYNFQGPLPKGLRFTEQGITGKPVEVADNEIEVTIVDEAGHRVGPTHFRLHVEERKLKLLTTSLPKAIVGEPFDVKFSVIGGIGALRYEFSGALPKGLNFKDNGIFGIPLSPGETDFEVTVVDEIGQKDKQRSMRIVSVVLDRSVPGLVSTSIPIAIVGVPFEFAFPVAGGVGKVQFTLQGKLPPGLKFNEKGIAGIPTQAGNAQFEVKMEDEAGNTGGPYSCRIVSQVMDQTKPQVLTKMIPPALPGHQYAISFSAEGGIGEYQWMIRGHLPEGLKVTSNGIEGELTKEQQPGVWPIQIAVRDDGGQSSAISIVELKVLK